MAVVRHRGASVHRTRRARIRHRSVAAGQSAAHATLTTTGCPPADATAACRNDSRSRATAATRPMSATSGSTVARPTSSRGLILAVVLVAQLMVVLDAKKAGPPGRRDPQGRLPCLSRQSQAWAGTPGMGPSRARLRLRREATGTSPTRSCAAHQPKRRKRSQWRRTPPRLRCTAISRGTRADPAAPKVGSVE